MADMQDLPSSADEHLAPYSDVEDGPPAPEDGSISPTLPWQPERAAGGGSPIEVRSSSSVSSPPSDPEDLNQVLQAHERHKWRRANPGMQSSAAPPAANQVPVPFGASPGASNLRQSTLDEAWGCPLRR
eukprot:13736166-Alexandrium_andersonii.AAC.1